MKSFICCVSAVFLACGSSQGGSDSGQRPDLSGTDLAGWDFGTEGNGGCIPGSKDTGEPCQNNSECASCKCAAVDIATGGHFHMCTIECTNHNQCAQDEICLYPTVRACVKKCSTVADCSAPYNACEMPTGVYKFCVYQ